MQTRAGSVFVCVRCGGTPIKLRIGLDSGASALIRTLCEQFHLDSVSTVRHNGCMEKGGASVGVGNDAPAVAGAPLSIDGAGRLRQLASDWQDQLVAFGRKPETAKAYRAVLETFIQEAGWRTPGDINSSSVERIITTKRLAKDWLGDTANRNVSVVRGFVKFLTRRGLAEASSAIDDVPRAKSDGTDGVRAATRQEAQRFLSVVCAREMVRNIQPANRTLQHLLMFLAGLRPGEAAKLEWRRHVILDAPIPFIHWTRDIQKNNRAAEIALHPELVELLRQHREAMKKLATTLPVHFVRAKRGERKGKSRPRPVDPDAEGSFVFPFVGTCFERDLERSGVPKTDHRGRAFSPRSGRKFFKSELTMLGVDGKIVDFLMRHRGGVDVRYLDLPKDFQLAELSKLPGLAPEGAKIFVNLVDSWLARRANADYAVSGEDENYTQSQLERQHRNGGCSSSPISSPKSAVLPHELKGSGFSGVSRSIASADELTKAAYGIGKNADSNAIADLLESLARLLRGGSGEPRRTGTEGSD